MARFFFSVSGPAAQRVLSLLVPLALVACGDAGADGLTQPIGGSAGSAGAGGTSGGIAGTGGSGGGVAGTGGSPVTPVPDAGGGDCNARVVESTPGAALHELQCSSIEYSTNPPSGGNHYGIWAAYQSYDFPLPVGYLVHSLEHGAVVFWYNCPEGCADEVAQVDAFIAALPEDPLCDGYGVARRTVLVPSPDLPSRWAASAWGFALTADCFDATTFRAFYDAHYGRSPETLCNPPAEVYTSDPCL